jgi:hypothetical protein
MPRVKQNSEIIDRATARLAGMKSIKTDLDLGKGITAQAFADAIDLARERMAAYNITLAHLDADRTAMMEAEKAVAVMSEKVLIGVAFEYGKDSPEYAMAGGVRKSQRKRPTRKATDKVA